MHTALKGFIFSGSLCSVAFIVYAPIVFVVTRRRHLWLRFLDALESFEMRLGFPKRVASFGRGFFESRSFSVIMVVFAWIFFLLTIANVIAYFYFRQRLT